MDYRYLIEVRVNDVPVDSLSIDERHDAYVNYISTVFTRGKIIVNNGDIITIRLLSRNTGAQYQCTARMDLERVPLW